MNRTAQSNPRNKFMSSTIPSMAQTQYKQEDDNKLFEALIEMRMQNMVTKLEEKGIK